MPIKAKNAVACEGERLRQKWLYELNLLKNQIENNEKLFNMTSDFDLIAYAIHEKAALQHRYSYILKLIKDYDGALEKQKKQPNVCASLMVLEEATT